MPNDMEELHSALNRLSRLTGYSSNPTQTLRTRIGSHSDKRSNNRFLSQFASSFMNNALQELFDSSGGGKSRIQSEYSMLQGVLPAESRSSRASRGQQLSSLAAALNRASRRYL
ncbi:MAG: hypothetical protein SFT92_02230 [Rickettsiales bacterium]|nr:hypothetical protein [Rickettsiales bacterium]